jgi:hypothetical protein
MWGTFILESYRWDERRAVANALEEIASSRDAYGFASGGVYCFWRLDPREVLYIGRAGDLAERFAQHNALRGMRRGSKHERIVAHFEQETELGFTVLVRAPNSQTLVGRLRRQVESDFGEFEDEELLMLADDDEVGNEEIAHAEGIAIRSYLLAHGSHPPWNRIGGELSQWGTSMGRPDDSGALMTGTTDMLLQARRTIRQLARDATATQFECVLQLARGRAVAAAVLGNKQLSDHAILQSLDALPAGFIDADIDVDRERIRDSRYILDPCPLAITNPAPAVVALRRAWTAGDSLPPWPEAPPLRST